MEPAPWSKWSWSFCDSYLHSRCEACAQAACRSGDCRTWSLPSLHWESPQDRMARALFWWLFDTWNLEVSPLRPLNILKYDKIWKHLKVNWGHHARLAVGRCGKFPWNQPLGILQSRGGNLEPFILPCELMGHLHKHLLRSKAKICDANR